MPYVALKNPILHGPRDDSDIPPDSFLDQLIAWGKSADDEIFSPRGPDEIYGRALRFLGPYENDLHRRAVMLEVMRVLAGHESLWNWNQGVDTNPQPEVKTPLTSEAGAWQVSANSMAWAPELRHLVMTRVGSTDPNKFQRAMKRDHVLAMEYIARLLRNRVDTHGPVLRIERNAPPRGIGSNLSRDAVQEFITYIKPYDQDWVRYKGHLMIPYRSMNLDSD